MRTRTRVLLCALLAALALVATSTSALAATPRRDHAAMLAALRARRSSALAAAQVRAGTLTPRSATYPQDAWDSADDTWTTSTALSGLPVFSGTYLTQSHSFYTATGMADSGGDQDWFSFTVDQAAYDNANTYLFEAVTPSVTVDPVIELYKADGSGQIHPTPPSLIPNSTDEITDTPGGCIAASDNGFLWFMAGTSESLSFSPDASGTYYFRVRPYYDAADGFEDGAGPYQLRAKVGQLSRIGGSDRFHVAVNVSREQFPNNYAEIAASAFETPTVVVANGMTFSDALPAASLAYAADAPLLLLPNSSTLPTVVRDEIVRLGATRVIIVGGTASVPSGMQTALRHVHGVTRVERVSGANRYSNAVAIARRADSVNSDIGVAIAPFAFVVSGEKFPDALSATPLSAFNIAPILFTRSGSLDTATKNYINSAGITDVCIVGGTASVSSGVENTLKSMLGSSSVRRVAGADRYEVSKNFAKWACELTEAVGVRDGLVGTTATPDALFRLEFGYAGFASGEVFPDALAGGAFAGYGGAPVLLNPSSSVSRNIWEDGHPLPGTQTDWYFDVTHASEPPAELDRSYLFGGPKTISDAVSRQLDRITGPGPDAVVP